MILLKLIAWLISTFFLVISLKKIKRGIINSVYVLYLGFYFFLVFPIFFDIVIGRPDYSYYSDFVGFIYSYNDFLTEIIYCMFIVFSSAFLFVFGKKRNLNINDVKHFDFGAISKKAILFLLSCIIFSPTYITIKRIRYLGSNIMNIFNYDYLRLLFRNDINYLGYYYLALFVVMSFIIILLISNKNIFLLTVIYALPLYIAIGIHGKRNIVGILIFLYTFVALFKAKIKAKNFKYIVLICAIFLLFFSIKYQENIRGIHIDESFIRVYTNFRVDYGRDDVVKMAIYYSINNDGILKNQSNSQLYFLKFISGLFDDIRSEYKYSVYATSKLLGYSTPKDLGWGMTTGIYDESISNYGIILGTILSNVFLCVFCRIGDKTKNSLVLIFTYITGFLFMVLQLTSFIFIFATWIILIIYHYFMKLIFKANYYVIKNKY